MTFIVDLLDSKSPASKAALRSVANGCLMRAINVALRLARQAKRHVGRGVDGANDMAALRDAAYARAAALNDAGRDAVPLEEVMFANFRLYSALHDRLLDNDSEFERAMTIEAGFDLATSERELDTSAEAELLALSKLSGMSIDDIKAAHAKDQQRMSASTTSLVPLAETLLKDTQLNGLNEDQLFIELPVHQQFNAFAKATEAATIQLQRDVVRAARFLDSPVPALRKLALSDTAVNKADVDSLNAQLERFILTHASELNL